MSAFTLALTQFFTMFSNLFSAANRLCITADNLATVAEESSGSFKDQARIDREVKVKALEQSRAKRIANEQQRLEAPADAITA